MDDTLPNPLKNFTPRRNPEKKAQLEAKISENAAIDITDKAQLRNLAIKTLVSVIQANPTSLYVVPALKELFDRVDGKASQQINIDQEVRHVHVTANITFADELPATDNASRIASRITDVIDNNG
jgi:hypothetical protein